MVAERAEIKIYDGGSNRQITKYHPVVDWGEVIDSDFLGTARKIQELLLQFKNPELLEKDKDHREPWDVSERRGRIRLLDKGIRYQKARFVEENNITPQIAKNMPEYKEAVKSIQQLRASFSHNQFMVRRINRSVRRRYSAQTRFI